MQKSTELTDVRCTALYSETKPGKDGKQYTNHFAVFEWSEFSRNGKEWPQGICVTASEETLAGLEEGQDYNIEIGVGGYAFDAFEWDAVNKRKTDNPIGRRVMAKNTLFRWKLSGEEAPAPKKAGRSVLESANHRPGSVPVKSSQPPAEEDDDLPF